MPQPVELPGKVRRQREAVARQGDCRCDDLPSGQRAVAFKYVEQAVDAAGYADGQVGRRGQSGNDFAVSVQEHIPVGLEGRLFAVIVGDEFAIRQPDHHETATAEIAGGRVGHRQGEPHGDGGVDGVAARSPMANARRPHPPCRSLRASHLPTSPRTRRRSAPARALRARIENAGAFSSRQPRQRRVVADGASFDATGDGPVAARAWVVRWEWMPWVSLGLPKGHISRNAGRHSNPMSRRFDSGRRRIAGHAFSFGSLAPD